MLMYIVHSMSVSQSFLLIFMQTLYYASEFLKFIFTCIYTKSASIIQEEDFVGQRSCMRKENLFHA